MLKDASHSHKLELIRLDEEAGIRTCAACTQEIRDNSYYSCPKVECNYFLHKFSGEMPLEIKHGLHPAHPLTLAEDPRYRKCNACKEDYGSYIYSCKKCDYDLHLICATLAERRLEHYGHPHSLTLQLRKITTYCNCCGKEHRGVFYQCQKCVSFWIHQDCASFAPIVEFPNHPHPLHFVYSDQNYYNRIDCDICSEVVHHQNKWYLQCVPCNFFSHVYCAMYEEKHEEVGELDSEIPYLPWEDGKGEFGVIGLLNRKIETNDEEMEEEQMRISHFSHPEHELILQAEVPKVEDLYNGHLIPLATKCNGCTRKISSPFYRCLDDCDFFLHKCCAFIQSSIPQHPEHRLVQSRKPWHVDEVFYCECCDEFCNGFCFECEEESCEYKVDLECAFLPTTIVHKSHPFHHLTLTNPRLSSVRDATCCRNYSEVRKVYECGECDFLIHCDCAMYPAKTTHRYDHEKPFKLWYDRGAVEANYFYCERCEEYIYPKVWYYHSKSSIGDQLMHPNCILHREHPEFQKFKSGRNFLQTDIHPHRLHLSPSLKSYSFSMVCSYCEKSFKEIGNGDDLYLSYNCWEPNCGFRLHLSCSK